MRKDVDVREVSCGSTVEQGEQLVAGQFFRRERRSSRGLGGRRSGGALTARSTKTAPSALRMTIRQNVSLSWIRCADPAMLVDCGLQCIARSKHMPAFGCGEEVEVFGRPGCQVLREQGCPACQQEALTVWQGEEQPGHL